MKKKISESLGIAEKDIDLTGIKNTGALEPLVNQFIKIQANTGMKFPPIQATSVRRYFERLVKQRDTSETG